MRARRFKLMVITADAVSMAMRDFIVCGVAFFGDLYIEMEV